VNGGESGSGRNRGSRGCTMIGGRSKLRKGLDLGAPLPSVGKFVILDKNGNDPFKDH